MKQIKVVVPWKEGLHMRPAARLVKMAMKHQSSILLQCGEKLADMRSIVSILSLCASMGMTLDIVATGEDEREVTRAVEQIFCGHDAPHETPPPSSSL